MLLSENSALKAAVVEFTKNLQKLSLFEQDSAGVGNRPKLVFDTGYGRRRRIIMLFVEMMSKELIENTEKSLFEFLSETTNLGSVSAIKILYYRCQREYVGK